MWLMKVKESQQFQFFAPYAIDIMLKKQNGMTDNLKPVIIIISLVQEANIFSIQY